MGSNTEQNGALAKMLQRDKFTVELLPQKKGYLKRHVEYSVQSERFKSQVFYIFSVEFKMWVTFVFRWSGDTMIFMLCMKYFYGDTPTGSFLSCLHKKSRHSSPELTRNLQRSDARDWPDG